MKRYVLAMDQGTTSSRAMLVDRTTEVCGIARHDLPQIYPAPGWVSHDPREIASTMFSAMTEVLIGGDVSPEQIDSIGITNQRETTVVWDRETGEPVCDAIVWQCRRTSELVNEICADPQVREAIHAKTGLVPDAYFSASKIAWILREVPGAAERAARGELAFGTVDTWLVWCLTRGAVHATDPTNASRTMLYDIRKGCWDRELLDLFGIPESMMPEVKPSSSLFGHTSHPGLPAGIPITGVAGDQQAALFGQCCFTEGRAKNTYGTGCFLLMHTGNRPIKSAHGLLTTVAASAPGTEGFEYALEGSVFMAGALFQWLRDEMGLIADLDDVERLAMTVDDTAGVVVVPAFTGLGAPWWDQDARGAILGLTRGAGRAHVVRACVESLAYQVYDVARTMELDSGVAISEMNVDGGASVNDFLIGFQADLMGARINRPRSQESTGLGAAYLAGLASGFWQDVHEIRSLRPADDHFSPTMSDEERTERIAQWHAAVERTKSS